MSKMNARALRGLIAGATLALVFAQRSAQAHDGAHWEILGGRSVTLQSYWTNTLFIERIGDAHSIGPVTWSPGVGVGWIGSRSTGDARLDRNVALLALGVRAPLWRGFFVGEQLGITCGKTDALSSTGEFVSTLGWEGGRWVAMVRHISNADLHSPNHGETMLMLGFTL